MSNSDLIVLTEKYVKQTISRATGPLIVAHDFNHVDRVRKRALQIAKNEHFDELEAVELAALLHDTGLTKTDVGTERSGHGETSAQIAIDFLKEVSNYQPARIEWIADAIRYHSVLPPVRAKHLNSLKTERFLTEILCDADMLDSLGAIGLMRACASKYYLPEYDPSNIKGENWGLNSQQFWAKPELDKHSNNTVIDQINQQIRYFDSLHTKSAKQLARPLIDYMKDFVLQIERETTA